MSFFTEACHICQKARWLFMSLLIIGFLAWGLWGWFWLHTWFYDVSLVVEYDQGTISDKEVKPYQSVVIKQPVRKFRDCPGTVQRLISGDCGHYMMHEGNTAVHAGFDGQLVFPLVIPDTLLPGDCFFQQHTRFRCNLFDEWLHRQVYEAPPIHFRVLGVTDETP